MFIGERSKELELIIVIANSFRLRAAGELGHVTYNLKGTIYAVTTFEAGHQRS